MQEDWKRNTGSKDEPEPYRAELTSLSLACSSRCRPVACRAVPDVALLTLLRSAVLYCALLVSSLLSRLARLWHDRAGAGPWQGQEEHR